MKKIQPFQYLYEHIRGKDIRLWETLNRLRMGLEEASTVITEIEVRPVTVTTKEHAETTFGISIDGNLIVGEDLCPHRPIPYSKVKLIKLFAVVKEAATGADIIFDVLVGGASILGATKITIPAGSVDVVTRTNFAVTKFVECDIPTVDILQVGSTFPGETLVIVLLFEVT